MTLTTAGNELGRYLALTRYYAARARRERFMCQNEAMALHWSMKASAALVCLQAQIEIDASVYRGAWYAGPQA